MSLLECICCPKHRLRTAVAWDDPSERQTCFHTYADLLHTAEALANALSALPTRHSPIAIYGRNCPSVLAAILAVMMLPMESPRSGCVACFPLSLDAISAEQERSLQQCGVRVVLVEQSVLQV